MSVFGIQSEFLDEQLEFSMFVQVNELIDLLNKVELIYSQLITMIFGHKPFFEMTRW